MATTMNPPAGALERQLPDQTRAMQEFGADFVRQAEFRLFKWLATFVVAAVAAAIGLLYQQVAEVRVEMERLRTDLVQEMNRQFAVIRDEMDREHTAIREDIAEIREDIAALSERVVRVETLVGGRKPSGQQSNAAP